MDAKSPTNYRKLESTRLLKRVMTLTYLRAKLFRLGKPIAWVTSGAPVELVRACGFIPLYPENYGALCGARKCGVELCQEAENAGYSMDLCAYARAHLGSIFNPVKAPQGGLPKPDCLIVATNVCNTLLKWFERVADHLAIPIFVIDYPTYLGEEREEDIEYICEQLKDLTEALTSLSGRTFSIDTFTEIMKKTAHSLDLWTKIRQSGKVKPSPINAPDLFIQMAPIVNLRGTEWPGFYYARLLKEIEERIVRGEGAIRHEKYRLLWDNIAIWYVLFDLFNFFAERDACFVVTTYTDAWAGLIKRDAEPYRESARLYQQAYLNLSLPYRAQMMIQSVREYDISGIVMHSDRSCKPYSLGQAILMEEVRAETGVPGIIFDADMVDSRFYTESQIKNRLEAFMEMLANR